jgi:hypothetical protein
MNLGEDQRDKIHKWIKDFSHDTEDVTGKAGRQAIQKVSEWNANQ